MKLYNYRNEIIRLFLNRDIRFATYKSDAKSDEVKESKQKTDESVGERVKLRRQESGRLNKMITKKDEIINKDLLKNIFHSKVCLICKKKLFKTQNAQKIKIEYKKLKIEQLI